MKLNRRDLEELVRFVADSTIAEFQLELGDVKLRLRKLRAASAGAPAATRTAGVPPPAAIGVPTASATASPPAPESVSADRRRDRAVRPGPLAAVPEELITVKAPLIGTFYRAPAPGAPPFIEVGSVVDEDKTVCIIEVMKLMNEVPAGCKGRVAEICVENGSLVEYGQPLIVIDPRG